MLSELKLYKTHLWSFVANLAWVLDSRFSKNIQQDDDIFREHCTAHDYASIDFTKTTDENNKSSKMNRLSVEDSTEYASGVLDDGIKYFLRSTTVGDKKADSLL